MDQQNWILKGILAGVVALLLLNGYGLFIGGGVGTPFIEDYDPFVKTYGINTEKDITTTGTVTGVAATFTGTATFATTTVTTSPDGFTVGGTISTAATGTVRTLYTNSTGPKLCDASTSFLYVNNNGSFSPSLVFSVGTSTTAIASTNLVASSTVATTTDQVVQPTSAFVLAQGDLITAIMGDHNTTGASSTYFGNVAAEFSVWCQSVSI